MPYSDPDNKGYVLEKLIQLKPVSVLDVGPGAGIYGELCRQVPSIEMVECVEIWEPYIAQFNLTGIYDVVHRMDVREFDDFDFDVVIFGDVLEHMSRLEALAVYERARRSAKTVIFSIPIIHLPQGPYAGNPHETHVEDDWKHEEILKWFPGITEHRQFRVTGVYVANDS